jgi:hypothetical protein
VPILGTGKVDNVAVAKLVAARPGGGAADDAASSEDADQDIPAATGPQAAVGAAAR